LNVGVGDDEGDEEEERGMRRKWRRWKWEERRGR
jgi:hypothetical protein